MSGPGKQESPLEPCGLQEANAEQDTGGHGWMCTRQRAAHSAQTEESRGVNIRRERASGRPEDRNKGKTVSSCCGQRKGVASVEAEEETVTEVLGQVESEGR